MTRPVLSLYHFVGCPYCERVWRVVRELGLVVEGRDIDRDSGHERALLEARGRRTVPVLRIEGAEGDVWMPESADIVAYLRSLPRP